jgi:hypothetical protein
LLDRIFDSKSHFNGSFFQVNENDLIFKVYQKQIIISQNAAVLDKFLPVSDFTRTDKILFLFFNYGFFGPSDSGPESNGFFVLSICDETAVV